VRYVDFHGKDAGIALVRFTSPDGAKTALGDVTSKKIKIAEGAEIAGRILEGDEEKKYWAEKVTPFTTAKPKFGGRNTKKQKRE
jgi:cytoskeletal protein CcmA (bactofilin family)